MRNTVLKVGLFLCSLFLLSSTQVSALSAKQLALTEDPFHYKEASLKKAELNRQKEAFKEQEEAQKKEALEKEQALLQQTERKPVQHTVTSGESLVKIAENYNTTWDRLYAKNTQIAQPDIINVNDIITIPEADEAIPERAAPVVAPVVTRAARSSRAARGVEPKVRGSSAGNTYTGGYCTWYAKERRPDLPNRLGNASAWVTSAAAQGFATGSTPQAGAIGQQGNHVVYVESVNGDGTVTVSEMNYKGLGIISNRTVSASNFRYIY